MRQTGYGINDNVQQQIDRTHGAGRVSLRPSEKGVFGSYSVRVASGAFAAGALTAAVIASFRWSTTGVSCIMRRIYGAVEVTTAFAQGGVTLDAIRGTGVAAQYTGGAVFSLAGKSGARSTRMGGSQQQIANIGTGNIAIASTTALVAPTPAWTLDNQAFASSENSLTTGLPLGLIFEARAFDEPMELQNGEGILVRATTPATGVVNPFAVIFEWDEVDPARYFSLMG
jgi:ribosomal protein S5